MLCPPAVGLESGHLVGAYEILGRLGAGGMGEVYQARDTRLGRLVAIKFLSKDLAADPTAAARLAREARLTSSLNHPNIVTVHDVGEHDGQPFIVMEFIAGRSLGDVLASGRVQPARAANIARQVADGLASAHAAGVVHRDLKPGNIMLTDDGRVKIVDFGLGKVPLPPVRADDVTALGADLTAPHVIPGTIGYMSPEQVNGEPIDYRTDQFALGALLYEMLTGRRAFRRDTRIQTMAAIVESEPPAIAQVSPDTPDELIRIVERCLAKQPAHRYASTQDLARDLLDLHVGVLSSRSATTIGRARVRARWRWGTAALAVLLLGLTGVYLLRDRPSALDGARALLDRYDKVENVNRAVALLEPAVAERPDDPERVTMLAEAYWRRFEYSRDRSLIDRAANAASSSLRLDADYAPTHVVLAMLNNGQARWEGAAGEAKQAIDLSAGDSRAWRELGRASVGLQKMDDARQAYLEAVRLGPSDWTAHNHLGGFYFAVNQLDLAAESFQRVIDLTPDNTRGYNNLGSVSLRLERFDRAAEMYERSLSLDRNATAFANLGRAYYEQGLYAEAARSYEGAVSLPGPTFQLWSNLGAACYWVPDLRDRARVAYETAITLGREAREVRPKDVDLVAALADAHAVLAKLSDPAASARQAAEARALIAAIEALRPQGADVLFTVASTLEELGDRAKALEWLDRAIAAGYPLKSVERSPFLKELRQDAAYVGRLSRARQP